MKSENKGNLFERNFFNDFLIEEKKFYIGKEIFIENF